MQTILMLDNRGNLYTGEIEGDRLPTFIQTRSGAMWQLDQGRTYIQLSDVMQVTRTMLVK